MGFHGFDRTSSHPSQLSATRNVAEKKMSLSSKCIKPCLPPRLCPGSHALGGAYNVLPIASLILRFRKIPLAFGYSYTVPVCKLQDSRTKAVTTDDFRGIAISPIISKTFEHCVLKKFGDYFRTHDNQFAFKKGRGCSHAIYAARNAIERLVNGGSTCAPWTSLRRTIKLITVRCLSN